MKLKIPIQNRGYAEAVREIGRILQKVEEEKKEKYPKEKIEEILEKPKEE